MKVVTETGSTYEIDEVTGRWRKNTRPWETTWWAYGVDTEAADSCTSWSDVGGLPKLEITPGRRLYIGSRGVWWLSTRITEVIEDGEE